MSKTVDFIYDFASPNAYLVYKVMPQIEQRTGAKFNLVPCLLGGIFKLTDNKPPMVAFQAVKLKLDYERLELMRFVEKHRLDKFRMNDHFPVNTLMLMRGAIVAEREGYLDHYLKVGFKAMWEDGKKMDEESVFAAVMDAAQIDSDRLLAQMKEPSIKQQLLQNTQNAVARGVFGVPMFFVGQEMFFGKDRLDQVEAELTQA